MKILIVDDERECVDSVITALKPSNYECEGETEPMRALELYKEKVFDVVITDMRMPKMSGIELLQKIREYNPRARVIIMTGYGDLDSAIKAINNKAYAFFGKPVNFDELINLLRSIEIEISGELYENINIERIKIENSRLKEFYREFLLIAEKYARLSNGRNHHEQ